MIKGFIISLLVLISAISIQANDFQILVRNYNTIHPVDQANFSKADKLLADMNSDGSFKSVKYNDKSRGMWDGRKHWYNLRVLAGAWNAGKKEKYRDAVNKGAIWWGKNLPKNSNWWWQEIGIPILMIRVVNNMNGAVSDEAIEALRPAFERAVLKGTGQNLADAAVIHLWKGVFYRNGNTVREAVDCFRTVIKISPVGKEGLQADFSFHQHGPQQQFGNYGRGYLENCSTFLKMLSGTAFVLSPQEQDLIWNYFYHGTRWTLYKKQMDILSCGRQITHTAAYKKYDQIKSYAKRMAVSDEQKNTVNDFFASDSMLEGSNYFFRSDYLVHRRKNFYFSYKMCSDRVIGSETINKENLQGLYLGCGVMQYKISGSEYDNMPCLWDWRRLPGLTAVYDNDSLNARGARKKTNLSSTVGAVTDNKNTGIMMECCSSKLGYFKSVTAIDKTVIFSLNNIRNKTNFPVNTTIDSRLYRTPVEVITSGGRNIYKEGIHKLENVTRIIHDSAVYTFLKPQNLTLAIEEKSVPWNSINVDAKGIQKGKIMTIYADHGIKPQNDWLSYAVSPADGKTEISSTVNQCGHIIQDTKNNICFAYFFAPGEMDIPEFGKLSSDKKAAVMLTKETLNAADIQQKSRFINIKLNGSLYKFTLPGGVYAGKSVTLSK